MRINDQFDTFEDFEWDTANKEKNWKKHQVKDQECEEIFFNKPLLINKDNKHSSKEIRFHALGRTNKKRRLLVIFTMRKNKIRVISARDQNKKERIMYDQRKKENTSI